MQGNPNALDPDDDIEYNPFMPPIADIMDDDDDMLWNSPLYLYLLDTETPDFDYNHFEYLLRTFPQYIQTTYPTNTLTARQILNLDNSATIRIAIQKGNARAFGMLLMASNHTMQQLEYFRTLIGNTPLILPIKTEMRSFIRYYTRYYYGNNSPSPGGGSRIRRSRKSRKNHTLRKSKKSRRRR